MNSEQLREKFIKFFSDRGHKNLPPANLIPQNDPSVLFTTAGMQQFKQYYLNPEKSPAKNMVTCQPCLRTSDIDEVGDDSHLTFFEMLGNFSFGGYFKKEAIEYAWEFLTEGLAIDKSRIHATYFEGNDLVPEDIQSKEILEEYLKKGLTKIIKHDFKENFWSLGADGSPGGPTVEFYVDGVEIWNLVFNEYVFRNGQYEKSPKKGVDTGMGFERLLTVINEKNNVYETELFENAYKKLNGLKKESDEKSERIILDHLRAAVFLLADGILPSNKEQGYILRRLIRRVIIKARKLEIQEGFIASLAAIFINQYQNAYPQLKEIDIVGLLEKEEDKFLHTLERGLKEFAELEKIDGQKAFDLYQSYGFPWEMTAELLEEKGIKVNRQEFEDAFKKHQEISRAGRGMFRGGLSSEGEQETKYHTATHLLLKSLQIILGPDVHQRGSNINAERLRLDFSYPAKLTDTQIKKVETIVNQKIADNLPVKMAEMTVREAKEKGAEAQFSAKYGEKVKVYSIGDFSREICGGPHVERTGVLGHFRITKEESSSAGVRRIKAVLE